MLPLNQAFGAAPAKQLRMQRGAWHTRDIEAEKRQ
jgi:hypothetical protein